MPKYVIADLSSPRSIPHKLTIVVHRLPFIHIIVAGEKSQVDVVIERIIWKKNNANYEENYEKN